MELKEVDKLIEDVGEFHHWLIKNRDKVTDLPRLGYFGLTCTTYINEYVKDADGEIISYDQQDEAAVRNTMRNIAKALGRCEKKYASDSFKLVKKFGDNITLTFSTNRKSVCRKIVVGTKKVQKREFVDVPNEFEEVEEVEWVCDDPLLASSH